MRSRSRLRGTHGDTSLPHGSEATCDATRGVGQKTGQDTAGIQVGYIDE
jgi:hypothetical protein